MDSKLFGRLVESMKQMDEIVKGERVPSRQLRVPALQVKDTQPKGGVSRSS